MKKKILFAAMLLSCGALFAAGETQLETEPAKAADTAPRFALSGTDGPRWKKTESLLALAGDGNAGPEMRVKAALEAAREIYYYLRRADNKFESAATREDCCGIIQLMESVRALEKETNPEIYLWLARCHARIDNLEIARVNLDLILKMPPDRMKKNTAAVLEAYLLRGDLLAERKQYRDAFQAYGLAALTEPADSGLRRLALFRQAKCAIAGGQRKIALELFRKLYDADTGEPPDRAYVKACMENPAGEEKSGSGL